jgi:hypothetical protein
LWLFFIVLPYLSQYSIIICIQSVVFIFSEGHIYMLKWKIYVLLLIVDFENCNVSSTKFLLNWKLRKLLRVILKFHQFHIIKYCVIISFCKMSRLCFHFLWCSPLCTYITKSKFLSQASAVSPFCNWRSHPSYLILLV